MKPVIPTLSGGPEEILRDDTYQIMHLIRHFLLNPGSVSTFNESQLPSFRKMEADYKNDVSALAVAIQKRLQNILTARYDNKYTISVSTYTAATESEPDAYGLNIQVTLTSSGTLAIPINSFKVTNNKLSIQLKPEFGN